MRSKRQQYHDRYSHCRTEAEKTQTTECRALWLGLAESYELLLEYEDKYPIEKCNESGQARLASDDGKIGRAVLGEGQRSRGTC